MPGVRDESVPDAGDILWIDFGPPVGREQGGRRPALVLTSRGYNRSSSVMLVNPITRTRRDWPFHVALMASDPVDGYVIADQIRVIDPDVRRLKAAGRVAEGTLQTVRGILASLFGIPVSR